MASRSTIGDPMRAAWTTTFVDRTALLLTFFVMVFAMSTMDEQRWATLSGSLVERGDGDGAEPPTDLLSVPGVSRARATRTDYLATLLRQRLEEAAVLAPYGLERDEDGVSLAFGADLLLRGEEMVPTAQGRLLLVRLAELLDPLANEVAVEVQGGAGDGLGAAIAVALVLRASGYTRPLAVRSGLGPPGAAERRVLVRITEVAHVP
jgi:chemotaxis protein MotB